MPAARAKNGRELVLALPATARAILAGIERRDGRDHVFGHRSPQGLTRWPANKLILDKKLGDQVRAWRLHDLRRTAATKMADIGIEPHIIEAALNHYSGHRRGVAGVYNRSIYERQIRAALIRWDEHLQALLAGRADKVISLTA